MSSMNGMIQCPNCRQKVERSNDFCVFCGTKLSAEEMEHTTETTGVPGMIRKCRNGHSFDDPDLCFCPVCGLPFEKESEEGITPSGTPKAAAENAEAGYPKGMYLPTEDDLMPRKKQARECS